MNRSYCKSLSDLSKEMKSIQHTISKNEADLENFFENSNIKVICSQLIEKVGERFESSIKQIQ